MFRYRLAIDLGTNSLGWAIYRIDDKNDPVELTRTGVRIFGYNRHGAGRDSIKGESLALTRRQARAMRRRRDRLLQRKTRLMSQLIKFGFFPAEAASRKELQLQDPYELREKGLKEKLEPGQFARALFHLNQRRGFQSNRKTDAKLDQKSVMNAAIEKTRDEIKKAYLSTAGQWLWQLKQEGKPLRARFTKTRMATSNGEYKIEKSYPLYASREMVEHEFEALWKAQAKHASELCTEQAYQELKYTLFYQRPLKPSIPGRCTLLPELPRAQLALSSTQNFRIFQELNHLRILQRNLEGVALNPKQKQVLVNALQTTSRLKFSSVKTLLELESSTRFNLEDNKRQELKGHATGAILSKEEYFGQRWVAWTNQEQDTIVEKILEEENEQTLIHWLIEHCDVTVSKAEHISKVKLPEGYGSLSKRALVKILPHLQNTGMTYTEALQEAGFSISTEINKQQFLPYYGEALQRHVGFGTGKSSDTPEKRFGKIANPTVHIGLNQFRLVVNNLIKRYGQPQQIVIEVARELRLSREQRERIEKEQAENQTRNLRLKEMAAQVLEIEPANVSRKDLEKMILWTELSSDACSRVCPYSGERITIRRLLLEDVETEHILPIAQTFDDTLNNKTVCIRVANRAKGDSTPWQAREKFEALGWSYENIIARTKDMRSAKAYRFGEKAMETWKNSDAKGGGRDFLARALNDTSYLSKMAFEYASVICPKNQVWVIPGRLTGLIRGKLGLNSVLGLKGEKNREDHRHHAVDACVVGIMDREFLNAVSRASGKDQSVEGISEIQIKDVLWTEFRQQVKESIARIQVSHKPEHGHEGAMHLATSYGLLEGGKVHHRTVIEDRRVRKVENLKVIPISKTKDLQRHGFLPDGSIKPYKGYDGNGNFCLEIICDERGKWRGEVISTFEAYQIYKRLAKNYHIQHPGSNVPPLVNLLSNKKNISGQALVMRLIKNDAIAFEDESNHLRIMRIASINSAGRLTLAPINEANVDARNRDREGDWRYTYKQAGSLKTAKARRVTISPIGELRDPGFKA